MSGKVGSSGVEGTPALDVCDLDVPFGTAPGLRGISFSVERGERFALVGASGVGKTSLLKAIAGSAPVAGGQVQVLGRDVSGLPPERRDVVFLSQRPLLFPHLSVFENVAFPLRVRGVARGEISKRVLGALKSVRMSDFESRRPQGLSGGQAHRVALARAVVSRPSVLLLDEPLTSLDPSLREDVRQSILAVHEEYGPALLLVTHDLQEAGKIADRVGVMLDGGLAQISSPSALFRSPASAEVARFLGLPNELFGVLGADGRVRVDGCGTPIGDFSGVRPSLGPPGAVPPLGTAGGKGSPRGARGDQRVLLVFGADAGRILPPGSGGIPVTLMEIHHFPEGATARAAFTQGKDAGKPPGSRIVLEVSLDPGCLPTIGAEVEVGFLAERIHVYPGNEDGGYGIR